MPGDGAYRNGKFGIDGNTHRIDDFCHHPTIVGLISCVIVQFTGSTLYVNKFGEDINIPIAINEYGNFVGNNTVTKMFAGVINWFICCAKTIDNRKGHLMSDISTSASLPGSVLSIITEIASIPGFRNEEFLINLRKAYMHGIGTEKGIDLGVFNQLFAGAESKIDAITEKAVLHEVKRQTLPVIINEVLVRGVYFVRRLVGEIIEKKDVMRIEWKKVIPYNNRTTTRMLTIATGTFTAVDMADAAVRASMKSVDLTTMMSNMILRVNFVGIGRFAIAVSVDLGMGVSKNVKRHSRIKIQEQELLLLNAKIEYKNAGMWKAAEQASETIEEAYEMAEEAAEEYKNTVVSVSSSLNNIGTMVPGIKKKNPSLVDEITDILEW